MRNEIKANSYSLTPGRYVGVAPPPEEECDFKERLVELNEELGILNAEAKGLEAWISENIRKVLETKKV